MKRHGDTLREQMSFRVLKNDSVEEFLAINEKSLLQEESMNNLLLGLSDSIKRQLRTFENPIFFTLNSQDSLVGQAIRSDGNRPLAISNMNKESLRMLAKELLRTGIELTGVVGPKESSTN